MQIENKTLENRLSENNSFWNENIENNIKNIANFCKNYTELNIKKSKNYITKYNFLIYLVIFLPPFSGFLLTLDYEVLKVPITIITFISGIISTIIKYSNFEHKSLIHKNLANKFISLENNINRQLLLCKEDRINDIKYLEWINHSYEELFNTMPIESMIIKNNIIIDDQNIQNNHKIDINNKIQLENNIPIIENNLEKILAIKTKLESTKGIKKKKLKNER
jgi:hypothetical protein